ncbi:carboxymuconolactone decarboxylase family protein [Domibacillus sp. A3M-37]|uniref:carboxymuconolactone decarboxylase family protein n=1 Tax=Domibacillus sp. A3M-37 TaxID=2962037 RepID=UPI0020B765FA|nr:carboxymuconolactone decarboxylase family protein [Domibacillus sp. A3M-37]MCP3762969.1 carboxymuconolactone decarboxylase family protein [Domibacillus sp. A3M-37]
MSKGLAYFQEVYDVVPGWVQKMHDYSPESLEHYTNLRGGIMADGCLSRKEKDILLVGINAARLYERSMVYHTKGAIEGGATVPELVEYLLVSYLYTGVQALQTGMKSLDYALSLKGMHVPILKEESPATEQLLLHIIEKMGDEDSSFVQAVLALVQSGDKQGLKEKIVSDSAVSKKLKRLLIAGIYTTELKGREAEKWMAKARENGATEEELAEVGLICLLTAGIPAWFEASDSLIEK